MLYQSILLPVFVLVGLTFAALFWTGRRVAPGSGARDGVFNYHLHTLFYVLIAYAITLRQADLVMLLLSWVFVVIQGLHAGLFMRAGDSRGSFFIAGALVLLAMWVYFAIRVLFPVVTI
ncbi:MAG: hypothetical protein EKK40_06715 [Bradyrhizobiaceae bacterium]|nr:MAG: hypothetical protein EKK40_06715 [Bradyrhizobiaceae bacterium]